uniref:Uncharacterized protein n=1 Tax=Eptatretus burgeri TaxID=7764 RepID=A0A8C4R071_EPTBU
MLKFMCLPFQRLASEFLSQKEEVADNIKKTETFLALYGDRLPTCQRTTLESRLAVLREVYELASERAHDVHGAHEQHSRKKDVAESRQLEISRQLKEMEEWLRNKQKAMEDQTSGNDFDKIQERQEIHQVLHRDILARTSEILETTRNTRQFLVESREFLEKEVVSEMTAQLGAVEDLYKSVVSCAEKMQQHLASLLGDVMKEQTKKVVTEEQLEEIRKKLEMLLLRLSELEVEEKSLHEVTSFGETESTMEKDGVLSQVYQLVKAHHHAASNLQPDVMLATQSCQSWIERHGSRLASEEHKLLSDLETNVRVRFQVVLKRSDGRLRLAEAATEALSKLAGEFSEFEEWLTQAELDLGNLYGSDKHLKWGEEELAERKAQHATFSDEVTSRRGDLRFIGVAAAKALQAVQACREEGKNGGLWPGVEQTCTEVHLRHEKSEKRYTALNSQCSCFGNQLAQSLSKYQEFLKMSSVLSSWMLKVEEESVKETMDLDAREMQKHLEQTKSLQADLTAQEQPLEQLKHMGHDLLDMGQDLPLNNDHIHQTMGNCSQYHM